MKKDKYFLGIALAFFVLSGIFHRGVFLFLGLWSLIMEAGYIFVETW